MRAYRDNARWSVLVLVAAAILALQLHVRLATGAPTPVRTGTLLVFESDPAYPVWTESNAVMTANLIGHFSKWTSVQADSYTPDMMDSFASVIYVGSSYRPSPLPDHFVDDVLDADIPVLWMGSNIWDLTRRQDARGQAFAERFGFTWSEYSTTQTFASVTYKGTTLTREAANFGIPLLLTTATTAEVVATANSSAGSTPWALRSGNFRYIAELPYAYVSESDRYLILADILFDHYGHTANRHRALIRLEDVSAAAVPSEITSTVDVLKSRSIPFGIHIIPFYVDPDVANSGANPVRKGISEAPDVVAAIQYALANGGELIMHGSTHQSGTTANPYDGVTGNDFEFFRAHVDSTNAVVLDGEVNGMDQTHADLLLDQGLAEIAKAGLPRPAIWTTPHYAATPAAYAAVGSHFGARLERGMYFNGTLTNSPRQFNQPFGQFFPYAVRDVYDQVVLPENIGNQTEAYNQHPARTPSDLVANAHAALVVRDGFASSFWHPYLASTPQGLLDLATIVDGVRSAGYTYVAPSSVMSEAGGGPNNPPTTTTTMPTTTTTTTTPTTTSTTSTPTTSTPTSTTPSMPTTTTTSTTTTTPSISAPRTVPYVPVPVQVVSPPPPVLTNEPDDVVTTSLPETTTTAASGTTAASATTTPTATTTSTTSATSTTTSVGPPPTSAPRRLALVSNPQTPTRGPTLPNAAPAPRARANTATIATRKPSAQRPTPAVRKVTIPTLPTPKISPINKNRSSRNH